MTMKVAILQCDEVLEKFRPRFGRYRDMIQRMFDPFDDTFLFETFDCRQGQYPGNIHDHDFYITTGSKASVYENSPWIKQLIEFVRELDQQQKKLIGICFGHQIMAMAAHGMVEKSDKGWGIGVVKTRMVSTQDWMSETPSELNIIANHQDQITSLPKDVLIIAENAFCPYFMLQWSDHFLSIQGHPEWDRAYSRALIKERRANFSETLFKAGLDSLTIEPDNRLFAQWIIDFIRQ